MGYDHGNSIPIDFEQNLIPFGSKSKGKLSPRSYPIQFERKWKYSFLSVGHVPPLKMNRLFLTACQSYSNDEVAILF